MNNNIPPNDFKNINSELQIELSTYASELDKKGLPCIYSLKHFVLLIDIEYYDILSITKNPRKYYRCFLLKKKKNGHRLIMAPHDKLKYIQRAIYNNILKYIKLDKGCIGFREKKSIKSNADIHSGKKYIMKIDLFRFFDSIQEKRVYRIFKEFGYHPNLAYDFAKLLTVNLDDEYFKEIRNDENKPKDFDLRYIPRIPQGAPTSPIISNIIATRLDLRLRKLCEKLGSQYSRYADDITISGEKNELPNVDLVTRIIQDEDFYVNKSKTRIVRQGQKQLVTGLTVTHGVHVPYAFKEEIKTHIYYCLKYGVKNHLRKIEKINKSNYREWLLGKILYVKSIENDIGYELLERFDQIEWY